MSQDEPISGESTPAPPVAPPAVETASTHFSGPMILDHVVKLVQVASVVAGVVVSVQSVNNARHATELTQQIEAQKNSDARVAEARAREAQIEADEKARKRQAEKDLAEAARPYLELRQKTYLEIASVAGILASPKDSTEEEIKAARKRFRQLYVSELSLVEGAKVEQSMQRLAEVIDPGLTSLTPEQKAAYDLAHELRDSLQQAWLLAIESDANESKIDDILAKFRSDIQRERPLPTHLLRGLMRSGR